MHAAEELGWGVQFQQEDLGAPRAFSCWSPPPTTTTGEPGHRSQAAVLRAAGGRSSAGSALAWGEVCFLPLQSRD